MFSPPIGYSCVTHTSINYVRILSSSIIISFVDIIPKFTVNMKRCAVSLQQLSFLFYCCQTVVVVFHDGFTNTHT